MIDSIKVLLYSFAHLIILNTKGTNGNVSEDLKEFLKCINGEFTSSAFSDKIKNEVDKVKRSEEWRREYMTLYLHEQEIRSTAHREGLKEGLKEGKLQEQEIAIQRMLTIATPEKIIELGYDKELVLKIANDSK